MTRNKLHKELRQDPQYRQIIEESIKVKKLKQLEEELDEELKEWK